MFYNYFFYFLAPLPPKGAYLSNKDKIYHFCLKLAYLRALYQAKVQNLWSVRYNSPFGG